MTNEYLPTPGQHCKHQTEPRNGWCLQCVHNYLRSWHAMRSPVEPPPEQGLQTSLGEALRALFDEQNGPPLETRKTQWEAAHRKALAALQWYDASLVRAENRPAPHE